MHPDHALTVPRQVHRHRPNRAADHIFKSACARAAAGPQPGRDPRPEAPDRDPPGGDSPQFVRALRAKGKKAAKVACLRSLATATVHRGKDQVLLTVTHLPSIRAVADPHRSTARNPRARWARSSGPTQALIQPRMPPCDHDPCCAPQPQSPWALQNGAEAVPRPSPICRPAGGGAKLLAGRPEKKRLRAGERGATRVQGF